MTAARSDRRPAARSQRPKATTVFAAAFFAGAAAAVGLNRTLDVHLAQRQPRVESEPIFVALRSLPQGAPLTVWDVALRDWPKAMLPAAALRPRDSFDGMVLKHAVREGQPILSVQLVKLSAAGESQIAEATAAPAATAPPSVVAPQTDLWAPAESPAEAALPMESVSQAAPLETTVPAPVIAEPVVVAATTSADIDAAIAPAGEAVQADVTTAQETTLRYLVIPERIALEADRSFVQPPAPEQPREPAAETVVQAPTKHSSSSSIQAGDRPGPGERPAPRGSSNRDRVRQSQPSSRTAAGQPAPAKQTPKTSALRSMMPSLSLGMGAVEPSAKPAAKPDSKSEQVPRSTFRGFGLFR